MGNQEVLPWIVDVDLCNSSVPLSPNQRPSAVEVFLPAVLLVTIMASGLSYLTLTERFSKKRKRIFTLTYRNTFKKELIVSKQSHQGNKVTEDNIEVLLGTPKFYTDLDKVIMSISKTSTNKIMCLLKISVPAMVSLVMCTLAIIVCYPLMSCIWPTMVGKPNINTAITCFLAPAGMVYALSFGFMYHQALTKFKSINEQVTEQLSLLDQIATMTENLKLPTAKHMMVIYKAIKAEAVYTMLQTQTKTPPNMEAENNTDMKVEIWSVIDVLRHAVSYPENNFNLNSILVEKMIHYLVQLNNICSDRMGALHSRIHPLKWVFLEILGVFSLFGIMFLDAKSNKMELAMIELTAISVSMLCYVLSDLDNPFNGFFRVDITVLYDVIKRVERMYDACSQKMVHL